MTPPTRRSFLAASGVVGLAGLAGCTTLDRALEPFQSHVHRSDADLSGGYGDPWPTLGFDARRSGVRPGDPSVDADGRVERVAPAGLFFEMPPTVVDDTVYFGVDRRGERDERSESFSGFVAHDVETGDERWRVAERQGLATPTVVGETVFTTSAGETRALDRTTGDLHWRTDVGYGYPEVSPTVVGERLYASGGDVVALDAVTGETLWESERELPGTFGTAATEDVVCATSGSGGEGGLYAFDPADGSLRWEAPAVGECYTPPVIRGETAYAAQTSGRLSAVSLADGTESWHREFGAQLHTPPAVTDDTAYLTSDNRDALFALDTATGETRWRQSLDPTVDYTPAIVGDTVFVTANAGNGRLVALDATTGEVRWSYTLDFQPTTGPVPGDGALYFGGETDGSTDSVVRYS